MAVRSVHQLQEDPLLRSRLAGGAVLKLTLNGRRSLEPFQNRFGRSLNFALFQNKVTVIVKTMQSPSYFSCFQAQQTLWWSFWEPLLGAVWRSEEVQLSSKRPFGAVLATRCLENHFSMMSRTKSPLLMLQRLPKKGPKTSRRQVGSSTTLLCDLRAKRVVKIRGQVARKPLRGGWGGGGGCDDGKREQTIVKLQCSAKTMQTAAEVCKFQKVDFWGGPTID